MLIFDNGIIKAYARIFPENRKRTRLEIEQTEESLLAEAFPGHKNRNRTPRRRRATAP